MDSKNYLGIAVLPILLKIIEAILKVDLRNGKFYIQSPLQRGFTENASRTYFGIGCKCT
jgi:hypothetical protein